MAKNAKPIAELRNWRRCPYRNAYIGEVYGHPRFQDGTRLKTSKTTQYNHAEGTVETLNTIYKLTNKADSCSESELVYE